jgi:hypothetical protein
MAAKGITDLDLIQMHHPLDVYCDFKPKLPILKVFAAIPTVMLYWDAEREACLTIIIQKHLPKWTHVC